MNFTTLIMPIFTAILAIGLVSKGLSKKFYILHFYIFVLPSCNPMLRMEIVGAHRLHEGRIDHS